MQAFSSESFVLPLPDKHRFPMSKYSLLRQKVKTELQDIEICVPRAATEGELLEVHNPDYVEAVLKGELDAAQQRAIGFPWSPQLVERSRRSVGATIMALHSAISNGVSVNLAGGTHHSFAHKGQGYCVFNDSAVAARVLQKSKLVQFPLIIDCDVHQGNGTASIFNKDASVFTFSIHCESNFPVKKETSDLDIGLADGVNDDTYLQNLENGLEQVNQLFQADCVIYVAGADAFHDDRLGKLALTKSGLAKRDILVFDYCRSNHLPVAVCMAGGYANDVKDIVDIHFNTVKLARGNLY